MRVAYLMGRSFDLDAVTCVEDPYIRPRPGLVLSYVEGVEHVEATYEYGFVVHLGGCRLDFQWIISDKTLRGEPSDLLARARSRFQRVACHVHAVVLKQWMVRNYARIVIEVPQQ